MLFFLLAFVWQATVNFQKMKGKLQNTHLKFGGVWVNLDVSNFEFYIMNFDFVWIVNPPSICC